jgi:hypothetical protein
MLWVCHDWKTYVNRSRISALVNRDDHFDKNRIFTSSSMPRILVEYLKKSFILEEVTYSSSIPRILEEVS